MFGTTRTCRQVLNQIHQNDRVGPRLCENARISTFRDTIAVGGAILCV